MSHSIDVQLEREFSYPIRIGMQIWKDVLDFCSSNYSDQKVYVIADSTVADLYGQSIQENLGHYFKSCHLISFPQGEESKSINQWSRLQDKLLNEGIERSTPLFAVGGGVTGDLAGFAAASVLRGVPLIHMPTSLLAMVDSSIGGKTGVNHSTGKNLIGAFYQPDAVFTDAEFLRTLKQPEWIGGLAEMLKYAAISNPDMFDELEKNMESGFKPTESWMELIRQSAEIKTDIVQEDEKEAGKRAWLNFGHTFGHALEKLSGYGKISHGEAVFVGMLAAVYHSKALGAQIEKARFSPFKALYPVTLPKRNQIPFLIEEMRNDKKVKEGTIRLILLNNWGDPYVHPCSDESLLQEAWEAAFDEIQELNQRF